MTFQEIQVMLVQWSFLAELCIQISENGLTECDCRFLNTFLELCLYLLRESDITKERIQKILATGANVILTTGGIDDMCLKYFVDAGAMAVRRVVKKDLKRIAKASGGMYI